MSITAAEAFKSKRFYCYVDTNGPKHDPVCIASYEEELFLGWTATHNFHARHRCGFHMG